MVEACNEGDFSKVRKLLDEGRVSVHDTTEEGESLLSLACSAGYYELAQVNFLAISRNFSGIKKNKKKNTFLATFNVIKSRNLFMPTQFKIFN